MQTYSTSSVKTPLHQSFLEPLPSIKKGIFLFEANSYTIDWHNHTATESHREHTELSADKMLGCRRALKALFTQDPLSSRERARSTHEGYERLSHLTLEKETEPVQAIKNTISLLEKDNTISQKLLSAECLQTHTLTQTTLISKKSSVHHSALMIQRNFRMHIEQSTFNKSQLTFNTIRTQINNKLPKDQHISLEEVYILMKEIRYLSIENKNLPLFFDKGLLGIRHSLLIDKTTDGYTLLIKPAVKNGQNHPNIKSGTEKTVKTSGIQINLNRHKDIIDIQQVVTVSKLNDGWLKDQDLDQCAGKDLIKQGFSKSVFYDSAGQERIIFVKRYLGENLATWKGQLDPATKVNIAAQLLEKFDWSIGDIKPLNTVWNGKEANYIDTIDMIFSYTTRFDNYNTLCGNFIGEAPETIKPQQIFGLACLMYELFNDKPEAALVGHRFNYQPKPKQLVMDKTAPFAATVNAAYLHSKEPDVLLQELKETLSTLKNML